MYQYTCTYCQRTGIQVQCVTTWRSDDKWFVTVRHLTSDKPLINCFVSSLLLTYLLTYLLTRACYQNDRQTPSSKNHEKQHNTHTKKPTYLSLSVLRFLILSLLVGFFMLTLLKNNGLYSVKTKIFQSILSILLVNCGGYRLVRTLVYRFCG